MGKNNSIKIVINTVILVHYNRRKGNDLLYYSTIVRKMLFQIYKLFKPSAFIKLKTSGLLYEGCRVRGVRP